MALQTVGQISLNDLHVEAGGTSGTQCSMNDSDIRGLISKGSATQMGMNEWYGASSYSYDFSIGIGSVANSAGAWYGYGVTGAAFSNSTAVGSASTTSGIIPNNNSSANTMGGFFANNPNASSDHLFRILQSNTNSPYQTASWLNSSVSIASSSGGANETTFSNNWVGLSAVQYFTSQKYAWQLSGSTSGSNANTIAEDYFFPSTRYSSTVYITI